MIAYGFLESPYFVCILLASWCISCCFALILIWASWLFPLFVSHKIRSFFDFLVVTVLLSQEGPWKTNDSLCFLWQIHYSWFQFYCLTSSDKPDTSFLFFNRDDRFYWDEYWKVLRWVPDWRVPRPSAYLTTIHYSFYERLIICLLQLWLSSSLIRFACAV